MKAVSATIEVACPVCEATTTELYLDAEDQALESSEIGPSRLRISPGRVLRCRTCRFGFRQRRSSPEQLRELYREMDPGIYESEMEGRNRTAQKHLQIVHRRLRQGRLLDVGCASGLFLSHALKAGWSITGIEPNEKLCDEARRNLKGEGEVLCATLEAADIKERFDVITLWDVLEHVPDPLGFLRDCRQMLRPNGYLFLNVPDLDSLEARVLGRHWPLLLPEHLNYFNRRSLKVCGERAGLRPLGFGRRRASFSLKYVAFRVTQHGIPGSRLLRAIADSPLGRILIPISLGETFAVWKTE